MEIKMEIETRTAVSVLKEMALKNLETMIVSNETLENLNKWVDEYDRPKQLITSCRPVVVSTSKGPRFMNEVEFVPGAKALGLHLAS